jgi:hypothetical protein
MFAMTVDRLGMNQARPQLETRHFRRSQHELF